MSMQSRRSRPSMPQAFPHWGGACLQILYMSLSAALLGSLISIVAAKKPRRAAALSLCVALGLPLFAKVWPLAETVNPINLLLSYRALACDLSVWAAPSVCLVLLGATTYDWDFIARTLPRGRLWLGYWALVAFGAWVLVRDPALGEGITWLSGLFYGGSPEGYSFLYWSYSVIVWLGAAVLLIYDWSESFFGQEAVLLLRYGSAESMMARQILALYLRAEIVAVGILVVSTVLALPHQDVSRLDLEDVIHHLLVGPAVVMCIVVWAIAGMWAAGRSTVSISVIGLSLMFMFPLTRPLWPFPVATAFQSARLEWSGGYVWLIGYAGALMAISISALLTFVKYSPYALGKVN